MINPKHSDIGRKVIYIRDWMKETDYEYGIISSISNSYVFVRYGHDNHSKATRRQDLRWE